MMKKISILLLVLVFLSSVLYADSYSYTGSGSEFSGASLKLPLSVDKSTWLSNPTTDPTKPSKTQESIVFVGFYDLEEKETLYFSETQTGSDLNNIYYTASSSFMVYIYCLSNSVVNVKLKWSDMSCSGFTDINSSSNPTAGTITYDKNGVITYVVENVDDKSSVANDSVIFTSNPSTGIFSHKDVSLSGFAAYEIPTSVVGADGWTKKTFTGTMTVYVGTTS